MISYTETMEAYHQNPALSNSKINVYRQDGPVAFGRQYVTKTMERPDSGAFQFGRSFDDSMFLSLADFNSKYVIRPAGIDGRTKEGKAWLVENEGREIISMNDRELMDEMQRAITMNKIAVDAFAGGSAQVTIRRELASLGLSVQARPDYLKTGKQSYLVDLKTTTDIDIFHRNCVAYGYHRQLALGQWLLAQEGIQTEALLVVVEKKIAGRCRVLRIPEPILAAGWELIKRDIEEIAGRYKSGDWTDVQTEILDVEVPVWAERQLMKEVEE